MEVLLQEVIPTPRQTRNDAICISLHTTIPPHPFPMKSPRKPLDPVVKLGVGVLVGSLLLIGIGMFLSRPDRSIPPYSIGSQVDTIVAIHLPPWTSDPEIEALIRRFQKVGKKTRDFRSMKIRPTTPKDPNGRYQRMTIYIFSNHTWTGPEVLSRYLGISNNMAKRTFEREFEASVRGGYHIDTFEAKGWIGPIISRKGNETPTNQVRWLFKESLAE